MRAPEKTTFMPGAGAASPGVPIARPLTFPVDPMCGICGFAYSDTKRPIERERLRRMHRAIEHRGPDGLGEHATNGVALGHRRLSIIDLAGGTQPLSNEDGSVWVAFNGEIYNYRELVTRLEARGHRFRTRSDTEVLVHAYEEYGVDFVRQLNGMFAFAIHDVRRDRVVLARDHLGIKPLFYSLTDEGLFFGSEIKTVLAAGATSVEIDRDALQEYLIFRYTAGERTLFKGIRRLPPGHVAVWADGALNLRQFWTINDVTPRDTRSMAAAAAHLDQALEASVESQLMSDVPLGTFCSGGVDSGLVTAYAARKHAGALHTFSVGFDDPAWDETALARNTATRYGTVHHTVTCTADHLVEHLPRLIWHNDEPLSHPNSVPLYVLSRMAREHVTVVLTGEGSDELFCGYPRYLMEKGRGAMEPLGGAGRRLAGELLARMSGRRTKLFADLLRRPGAEGAIYNSAYVAPELAAALTAAPVVGALDERRSLFERATRSRDPVGSLSRYEMTTYLGCALDRMDRMSMAVGLEGRVPFLDVPLVEWGAGLPVHRKLPGIRTKAVVKEVAATRLSREVTHGPKSGFGLPLGEWFRSTRLRELTDRLRDRSHPAAMLFDRRAVGALLDEHQKGLADHGQALWMLVNVYLWNEEVVQPSGPRAVLRSPDADVVVLEPGEHAGRAVD